MTPLEPWFKTGGCDALHQGPGRLWSLWDMYKIDAHEFHKAVVILQQTLHFVAMDKQRAYTKITPVNKSIAKQQLENLKAHIQALCCPVSVMGADDLIRELYRSDDFTYDSYGQMAMSLTNTFENELTLRKVYVLDPLRTHFFQDAPKPGKPPPEPLFGKDVADKFPGVAYEIDQAGKCYACDLSTASAFHSIRCLEAGIRAVSRCLGIPDPTKGSDRSWFKVLGVIKTEMDKRWPPGAAKMSGDGHFFEEIHGALSGIQNPYRNATMHLDAVYTAPDAIHIFEMVKGFMVKISSRMDEEGKPNA